MTIVLDDYRVHATMAADLISEHLDKYLLFYRLRLERGTTQAYAKKWVKSWDRPGTKAFVYLNTQGNGFATNRELNEAFWGGATNAARAFVKRLRNRAVICRPVDGGEPTKHTPLMEGIATFSSPHGVAMSLGFKGIPKPMQDQVLAFRTITQFFVNNIRGVIEQVVADPGAAVERKDAAREILSGWHKEPAPKPQQTTIFDRTGTND